MAESPSPNLLTLVKIGSALVHAAEARGAGGHAYDWVAFEQCLSDPAVREWLRDMTAAGLLPVMRSGAW